MTGTELIAKFNLQVDDSSELSDAETLELLNDVYQEVQDDRDWEWLRVTQTGTTSTTVPYIALPSDFKKLAVNKDNLSVIFVGTDYQEYTVVAYQQRREHIDQDGFCYIDIPNQRLYFTKQPTSALAVEYDYIKIATAILAATEPLFRDGFHKILAFGAGAKFNSIELSDKATSYRSENIAAYNDILSSLRLEDAQIKLSL